MAKGRFTFLLVAALSSAGCLDAGSRAVGTVPAVGMLEARQHNTTVDIRHSGRTGESICVDTVLTIRCAYAKSSATASYVLECPEDTGFPAALRGNLTWNPGALPQEFSVTVAHRPSPDDEWTADSEDVSMGTSSPLEINVDFGRYHGDVVMFQVHGWSYAGSHSAAGLIVSAGEDFKFEGRLTCAPRWA